MKEKLIGLWKQKERYIKESKDLEIRRVFFAQAFGALEMMMIVASDWDKADAMVKLWENEWRERLEVLVYGF